MSRILYRHQNTSVTLLFEGSRVSDTRKLFANSWIEQKRELSTSCKCYLRVADWAEEAVAKAEILRLIYQGRFLHSNVTLGALGLPFGKTTVMHLVPRENLPEPNSQGEFARCIKTAKLFTSRAFFLPRASPQRSRRKNMYVHHFPFLAPRNKRKIIITKLITKLHHLTHKNLLLYMLLIFMPAMWMFIIKSLIKFDYLIKKLFFKIRSIKKLARRK